MPQRGAVVALAALGGAVAGGEEEQLALVERDHVGARLLARALLDQHRLAAVEVLALAGEHGQRLERERDVAVEILVERVVAALVVAEDQRRGPELPCGMAGVEERAESLRETLVVPEVTGPPVRRFGQVRVEPLPKRCDGVGQRVVEVLVLALAEAVAGHVDGAAEGAVVIKRLQVLALLRGQDRAGASEPVAVEGFVDLRPREGADVQHHPLQRAPPPECESRAAAPAGRRATTASPWPRVRGPRPPRPRSGPRPRG